jgi:ketosteroid isomerase-like protein
MVTLHFVPRSVIVLRHEPVEKGARDGGAKAEDSEEAPAHHEQHHRSAEAPPLTGIALPPDRSSAGPFPGSSPDDDLQTIARGRRKGRSAAHSSRRRNLPCPDESVATWKMREGHGRQPAHRRDAYAAFGRGDLAAFLDLMRPEMTFTEPEELPYGGTIRGKANLEAFFQGLSQYYDEVVLEGTSSSGSGATRCARGAAGSSRRSSHTSVRCATGSSRAIATSPGRA